MRNVVRWGAVILLSAAVVWGVASMITRLTSPEPLPWNLRSGAFILSLLVAGAGVAGVILFRVWVERIARTERRALRTTVEESQDRVALIRASPAFLRATESAGVMADRAWLGTTVTAAVGISANGVTLWDATRPPTLIAEIPFRDIRRIEGVEHPREPEIALILEAPAGVTRIPLEFDLRGQDSGAQGFGAELVRRWKATAQG